jgi:uncharacterized protein YkwD
MANSPHPMLRKIVMKISKLLAVLFLLCFAAGVKANSDVTNAVVGEINQMRSNPKQYAKYLREMLKNFNGDVYKDPNSRVSVTTSEGKTAVMDAVNALERLPALTKFQVSKELADVAQIQAADTAKNNFCGHNGSDGSNVAERFGRYVVVSKSMGENIYCGQGAGFTANAGESARAIVIRWLVDDGISTRGHREKLLSRDLKMIGISQAGDGDRFRLVAVFCDSFRKQGKTAAGVKSF